MQNIHQDVELYKPYKTGHIDTHFHKYQWIKPFTYRSFKQLHPYVLPMFIRKNLSSSSSIYHAHWFLSGLALTYYLNKPMLVTMHDVSILHIIEKNNHYQKYYRWALERFKKRKVHLITVSETAKKDTIHYAQYPEHLVHAIPNGINFERFYPIPKKEKNDTFTIIYAGGLGKRKNLTLLLDAFKVLEQKYPVRLLIAGAYPEKTVYPKIADSLQLKNVTFTGFIPDEEMNHFYNQGDLMIYPSEYEGFGFAPLEAMASGIPVLCTRGGALHEISGGGCLTFNYNPDDLIEKVSFLFKNRTQRELLAQRGLNWVKQYSWEKCALSTYQLYQQVAQEQ